MDRPTEADEYEQPLHLCLRVTENLLPRFCLLAGGGFAVEIATGGSVEDVLCRQLGVPADYLKQRVQTVFLDSTVVDDPETATVPPGSTLALSAAMPGIAGAMLRKDSPYAAMRSRIAHPGRDADRRTDRPGRLVVKLFNTVQAELGPILLGRGVRVPGRALADLFRGRLVAFHNGILAATVDESPVSPQELFDMDWSGRDVVLQVRS